MQDIYQKMSEVLGRCRRVLLSTHVRPDGDALGSVAALWLGLRQRGIEAEVLLLSHLPRKYAFVFHENGVPFIDVERGWPADFSLDRYEALVVLDTGTWSQLPGLQERLAAWKAPRLVIDHHLTQEDWADLRLVVSEAAATGEIVFELLEQWEVALDKPLATALFLAVASDTGWFQFANTRPYTLRLAAMLMEAGVDTDVMYQRLYQNESPHRVALQTRAMSSLELLADGRLAAMRVSKSDFEETGAHVPDTENLINIPLQIRTVEVSVLLTEPPEGGPTRVSLRSKGSMDVSRFAEEFGGGGHARAAGLKLSLPLEEAARRVLERLCERLTGRGGRL